MGAEEGTLNMGCACGSSGVSKMYNIEVTFEDGTKKVYASRVEARVAAAASGQTVKIRQVLAASNPVTA